MKPELKSKIESCQEIELYFIIDILGAYVWRTNQDLTDGRIENTPEIKKSIVEAHENIVTTIGQLARFGISPFLEDGKSPTKASRSWFRMWDNYVKNTLTDKEWNDLNAVMSAGGDLSRYRPTDM